MIRKTHQGTAQKRHQKLIQQRHPAHHRLTVKKRSKFLIGALILTLVVFGGFIFFSFFKTGGTITLEVRGPEDLKSGQSVYYTVLYENNTGRDLHHAEIKFSFPKSVELIEVPGVLTVEHPDGWDLIRKLSIVKDGRRARESFGAKIFGLPGDEVRFKAIFNYTDRGREFSEEKEIITKIEDTPLSISFQMPDRAQISSEFKFNVEYFNQGNFDISSSSKTFFKDIPNLELRVYYPDGFSFLSSERAPSRSSNVWFLAGAPQPEAKTKVA